MSLRLLDRPLAKLIQIAFLEGTRCVAFGISLRASIRGPTRKIRFLANFKVSNVCLTVKTFGTAECCHVKRTKRTEIAAGQPLSFVCIRNRLQY